MNKLITPLNFALAVGLHLVLIGSVAATPNKQPSPLDAPNKVQIRVDGGGMHNQLNIPTVSIEVCAPGHRGPSACRTIDNIVLDTGSVGLRLLKSTVSSLAPELPQIKQYYSRPLMACSQFQDGYTYGGAHLADVSIGGETAPDIPIQLIDDSDLTSVPNSCSNGRPSMGSFDGLDGNGILGVHVPEYDCGAECLITAVPGYYYLCVLNSCFSTSASLDQQIVNPVARFAPLTDGIADNNGIIIQLPPVGRDGEPSAIGTLIFGIDRRPNNMLDHNATRIPLGPEGSFHASYNGQRMIGLMDTGATHTAFPDDNIPLCGGNITYCPLRTMSLTADIIGINNSPKKVRFDVTNADRAKSSGKFAFNNIALNLRGKVIFGLPFFYGRHIAISIGEGRGIQPFIAF